MADPISAIGLVASVAQLIDATIKVVQYSNGIKNASKDQARLAVEASSLLSLLMSLRYDLENMKTEEDPWFAGIRSIAAHKGPLEQFSEMMEELAAKLLRPATGVKRLASKLLWPLEKKELDEVLERTERIKTMIALAYERDDFALSLAIKVDLNDVSDRVDGVKKLLQGQQSQVSNQERNEIISWLSPLTYGTQHSDISQRHQEGTGKWLLESNAFKEWQNKSRKLLWCPGMPGAGKTTLASFINSEIQRTATRTPGIGLAYAYCNYKHENETALNIMGNLLQQLLHSMDILPGLVRDLHSSHLRTGTRPKQKEITSCLAEVIGMFSEVFIVIDAFDEYDEGDGVRDVLGNALLDLVSLPNSHVLVTSRWLNSIQSLFQGCIWIEIRATDQDVSNYLEKRMESSLRLQRLIKSNDPLKTQIISTLVDKSEGM
ncbi:uncharacterized protein BDZ99DRAFT_375553 [Mytilinidion resinicola]|uniref:Nephrocystin 3-like N-terminal domain-containing protein n=1 Tax=Mytilinidion resinicola TaxID=574789 RepID=A0A6A6Z781_9PEZI|nr:uncharacterized protein BDZ99DRAFT_375553 [Mytilinidion resinicola]KAF2816569.1 hypothetical protein BDZ99DRAFT_375553 [Mytilinidion resinicola]